MVKTPPLAMVMRFAQVTTTLKHDVEPPVGVLAAAVSGIWRIEVRPESASTTYRRIQ